MFLFLGASTLVFGICSAFTMLSSFCFSAHGFQPKVTTAADQSCLSAFFLEPLVLV